ncbi:MAG TPA: M28 family peptidase [Cyclobacteriaceae bacterium]|nr:M28 family peptidase [Cyclobacteriaceae bacterium]
MKKILTAFACLLSQIVLAQPNPLAMQYAQLITTADLKDNLSIIASDALEGRYTGSRGQKMAAAFINNYFETLGLAGPVNGSHYMPVELSSSKPGDVYLKVGTNRYVNFNEIVYFGQSDSGGEISLEVVFAGKANDADLAYLDVKDKAVVILIDGLSFNLFGALRKTAAQVREKGARMVLAVANSKPEEFKPFADQLKGFLGEGSLSLGKPDASQNKGMFLVDQSVISKIFNNSFEKLTKASTDDPAKKPLAKIKPSRVVYQVSMETKTVKSENMLGYLEGTDKKDELIVVSAHFDHIGLHDGEDKVNNGADDDGSGTVTVLQLAKAFSQAKKEGHGPRRSILFMTVTGEEEGLFGSEYYVTHPVFPLANTVADLNIDMVGRRDPEHSGKPDYVYVIGSDKLSSELHEINERNNKEYTKLDFDYTYNDVNHPTNLYKRSDHWNFAKNNVPIVFYFDGIHEDYHKPSDEVSKIDFDLLAKRGKIVFYTAWELANRDNRIVVDKK